MKTYSECEQEFDALLDKLSRDYDPRSVTGMVFRLELSKALAVQSAYENELLRDRSNTSEMHALLERLGGKADVKVTAV